MATIEERAEELYPYPEGWEWNKNKKWAIDPYGEKREAYIKGAKEQKALDEDHLREVKKKVINKACEIYEKKLRELKRILNDKYGAGDIISIGGSLIDFVKEMEE